MRAPRDGDPVPRDPPRTDTTPNEGGAARGTPRGMPLGRNPLQGLLRAAREEPGDLLPVEGLVLEEGLG